MQPFDFSQLSPPLVWKHFQTLCNIPRPSKQEQKLRDHLQTWAKQRGLETYIDQIGNLIIRKSATQGKEQVTGVVLQGHLDMVTQANSGTIHDFNKDPIQPVLEQGWLIAKDTTLGADNGIGVALALAVLESDDISHGPIEVLLTIDEEAGMSGARLLESGILKSKWLFNIDTEEWGELYLGCAGSQDVEAQQKLTYIATPRSGLKTIEISVSGLKGGHSGVDIHLGRGNANVILIQLLHQHLFELGGYLVEFSGGSARNAIPREATASIVIDESQIETLQNYVQGYEKQYLEKLKGIDDLLKIKMELKDQSVTEVIHPQQQTSWLSALATCPYGVAKMSEVLENVVETSNNIGVIQLNQQHAKALIMVRSMLNSEATRFSEEIAAHFSKLGITSELAPLVSGWTPNPESAALKCLQQAYRTTFNIEPHLKVIHAGLECGIIAEHYPDLQMVSFGPDIQGAHAPGERVKVDTVEKCWKLLVAALESVK
ncbi:aminoacyl-histidine dipeptidase [Acinetobacter sp. S40]|uniref:aminoacyl-histidine dipeptidase n=1 Tax=Acinetobacter sp. S40 TaxID=2767434 RepID=UPI00190BE45C|nr:aminoacyl-histidine dipeptidase [Acinetobacter sp. S40]MBJ9985258.1 aminoacyl-histidine dipeptidase [Acinetobacter sp. S40]